MAPACPAEMVRLEAIAAPPFGAGGLRSHDRIRNQHFNSLLSFFFPFLGLFPFCYSLILEKFLCYSSCLCLGLGSLPSLKLGALQVDQVPLQAGHGGGSWDHGSCSQGWEGRWARAGAICSVSHPFAETSLQSSALFLGEFS